MTGDWIENDWYCKGELKLNREWRSDAARDERDTRNHVKGRALESCQIDEKWVWFVILTFESKSEIKNKKQVEKVKCIFTSKISLDKSPCPAGEDVESQAKSVPLHTPPAISLSCLSLRLICWNSLEMRRNLVRKSNQTQNKCEINKDTLSVNPSRTCKR